MTTTNDTDRDAYVDAVIALYRKHPHTTGRASKADRRLAQNLFQLRVAITTIEQALQLVEARRRSKKHLPVDQIQSLHYFFHTIREIHFHPIDDDYYQYLKKRLHQRS